MKKQVMFKYIPICIFLVLIVILNKFDFHPATKISENFWLFFKEMLTFLPCIFILIGILDVWIPKEKVEKHIGKESGIKGIFWVVLLATLQAGPLYAAFPVAYLLWKKGCGIKNIFIYLGAFSTLKIPMLTFEIGFLGLKFSLLRTLFTLPTFILIGYLMEFYLRNKSFEIKNLGDSNV
jgi:uncharacterized membrane protein YraQ (UPF0718 family)